MVTVPLAGYLDNQLNQPTHKCQLLLWLSIKTDTQRFQHCITSLDFHLLFAACLWKFWKLNSLLLFFKNVALYLCRSPRGIDSSLFHQCPEYLFSKYHGPQLRAESPLNTRQSLRAPDRGAQAEDWPSILERIMLRGVSEYKPQLLGCF